jgi:glycosyltransferase involved in cell wall biosynthesis
VVRNRICSAPTICRLRLAYLVSRYPIVSHTFIAREVRELRRLGAEVHTFTIRPGEDRESLSAEDRREADTTTALRPISPLRLAAIHSRALGRSPRGYLRTLALAFRLRTRGPRGTLWQAFYFVQAIVLADHLRRLGVDHVHVHHADVGSDVALLASEYSGGTWSLSLHGPTEFLDVARFRPGAKAQHAALVACISEFTRSELVAITAPEHHERFQVVRLGVESDSIPYRAPRDDADPFQILNVARMAATKGHAVLLEGLAAANDAGLAWRATLVGDGPERANVEALAHRLGLDGRIRLTGALSANEALALYAEADAFCLPSFAEGLPVVLMEAMASGVPVVASRTSGTPELVEDGKTGLLVDPGSPDQVAAALKRLASDPELRRELAATARRRIEDDYDLRTNVRRLCDLLAPFAG